ncbi:MAG: lipoate--protein ligase family protein [Planctomycetota bacterium]
MAVDDVLLQTASLKNRLTLRIYRWETPTLSFGYFQEHAARSRHVASQNCPTVRRVTGGGAIVHDREVTYSLTLPVTDRQSPPHDWYALVHAASVATLGRHGVPARLCPQAEAGREREFLCFQRRTAGDLLLDGWKIGGSAQRRQRQALLQHGSLLLQQSPAAPELPGVEELAEVDLTITSWLEDWIAELGKRLGIAWQTGSLNDDERALARQQAQEKFAAPKWALRR